MSEGGADGGVAVLAATVGTGGPLRTLANAGLESEIALPAQQAQSAQVWSHTPSGSQQS
jgi:hypothetical protein